MLATVRPTQAISPNSLSLTFFQSFQNLYASLSARTWDIMTDFWNNKAVCVTGGGGFLGYHIVKQLVERGADVRVFTLPPGPQHPLWCDDRVRKCFGDLRDTRRLHEALDDCDIIFHTAGTAAVWGPPLAQMHEVHVTGTSNVLNASPASARVVHTSSIVTLGATRDGEVVSEAMSFNLPKLGVDYVHAKRAAEETALDAASRGRNVVVVNPGCLVGPEDFAGSVIGRFCRRFWKGRLIFAPPGGFNFADVRDVATGHLLAAEKGEPGRKYILGGENLSLRDFMRQLAAASDTAPRALPALPAWLMHLLAGVSESRAWVTGRQPYPAVQHVRLNCFYWYVSSTRAERELGYRRRTLVETLRDTYDWFRVHKPFVLRRLNRWWMRPAA